MKKIPELEAMHPTKRRRFLKWMSAALAAPLVSRELRYACNELAGGTAYAQGAANSKPTYFIEVNLRDQWDQGHVMVAPSMASQVNLQKGDSGQSAALFFTTPELAYSAPHRAYLTNESKELMPHLDHIAMVDACEASTGQIHGHEAANPIRSPGRSYAPLGKLAMYENDPVSNFPQGVEAFYSTTPTPATLHNYVQRQLDPTLRSGVAFKGISRSIHTAYHFGAGLPGSELDRVRSKDELFGKFPAVTQDVNVLSSAEEAEALRAILARTDRRYLSSLRYSQGAVDGHVAAVNSAREILHVANPRVVSLPLTPEEEAYWGAGVPGQQCTVGDTQIVTCDAGTVKAQIWEQMAYAYKILVSGVTRSVALEFDFMDLHGFRPENALRTQAAQFAMPLARLIAKLKSEPLPGGVAGETMFERTVIAVYTTDGSRSPAADSYGDSPNSKNTLVLAGGMIRGGYYGDVSGGPGTYATHAPDPVTGAPMAANTRVASADAWRTVIKALGIADDVASQFPDVAAGKPLPFMLRS